MPSITEIPGGVTAAQGFTAGSVYCGIKAANASRPDIAIIHSAQPTVAAATFTTNRVKAAPVRVSQMHLRSPDVRAIIANAGNANACTGCGGIETAKRMVHAAAQVLGLRDRQVLVCLSVFFECYILSIQKVQSQKKKPGRNILLHFPTNARRLNLL